MTTQGMKAIEVVTDSMICGLISLTFVDSEVRTARIPQVWKCRLA